MNFKRRDLPDGVPLAIIPSQTHIVENVMIDELPSEGTPLMAIANVVVEDDIPDDGSPVFRDVTFSCLFFIHLAIMIFLSIFYGSYGIEKVDMNVTHWKEYMDDDGAKNVSDEDLKTVEDAIVTASDWSEVYLPRILSCIILPGAFTAFLISYIGTACIIPSCPKAIVMSCLLGSLGWTAVVMIWVIVATGSIFSVVAAVAVLGILTYYIRIVWHMIPFTSANLSVALQGISANWGMYVIAFFFSCVSFMWAAFWLYVVIGIMLHDADSYGKSHPEREKHHGKDDADEGGPQGFAFFLLLLSLYWTCTIMINTIQVTVAGVMGTWCFVKDDARSCCSPAVTGSLYRSLTYSFGSICCGSLLQAFISALRALLENTRNNTRSNDSCDGCGEVIVCIAECCANLMEDFLEYFNQWAYVFVGIYGYSYIDSGKKVVELFKARGWTSFVTNDLVGYVLGFTTLSVGIVNGGLSVILALIVNHHSSMDEESYIFGPLPGSLYWSFGLGFFVGISVASVMMSVVRGAVNTLIVCYADSPGKLEDNHPMETAIMSTAWSSAYPKGSVAPPPQYSVVV